jgi:glycosyltransferase involved in cell wall biosynthesis
LIDIDEKRPLISVIVPVYNTKTYLEKCIKSIVTQTYDNLEIILIDDGSDDGSAEVCDKWKHKDSRIRVFHTQNNGVSHARNIGLSKASGDYIGFVDSDDWIEPSFYDSMLKSLLKYNAEACSSGYSKDENTQSYVELKINKEQVLDRNDTLINMFTPYRKEVPKWLSWEMCDKLFERKLLKNIYFPQSIYNGEDLYVCWKIMKKINRLVYLPLFKYHYVMRSNSAVHQAPSEKTFTGFVVRELLLNDVEHENSTIKRVIENHYLYYGLYAMKQILLYAPFSLHSHLYSYQLFLRRNLIQALKIRKTTFKFKLGIIFFSLPLPFCRFIYSFLRKN